MLGHRGVSLRTGRPLVKPWSPPPRHPATAQRRRARRGPADRVARRRAPRVRAGGIGPATGSARTAAAAGSPRRAPGRPPRHRRPARRHRLRQRRRHRGHRRPARPAPRVAAPGGPGPPWASLPPSPASARRWHPPPPSSRRCGRPASGGVDLRCATEGCRRRPYDGRDRRAVAVALALDRLRVHDRAAAEWGCSQLRLERLEQALPNALHRHVHQPQQVTSVVRMTRTRWGKSHCSEYSSKAIRALAPA